MDTDLALQVLSVIIEAYAAILGIFSGFYLLFVQKVQAHVDQNGHLKGKPLDYFSRKSVDKSFWIFFGYTSSVIVSSLSFMLLLTNFSFASLLTSIVSFAHVLATVAGLVVLAFLIKKMIKLLPPEAP